MAGEYTRLTIVDQDHLVGECTWCTMPIAFGDVVWVSVVEGRPRAAHPRFWVLAVHHFDCQDPGNDRVTH